MIAEIVKAICQGMVLLLFASAILTWAAIHIGAIVP